ncbi:MerR family transcriptional regulator [Mycobacteroides abscessus]|uniref:helix-turn-helix domain-containing protein n=1 Tax=Mycobacteroides abscessus TaxID=36809 RepID=UPI000C261D04|nr:helix-turn-helix domain-containing protein [Mycobacteroides abscessus]
MSTTINASLYPADADEDSDPNAITLTATAADADAAWGELRARIASVLGVDALGDIEALDDDTSDPTAPADMKRGTLDGRYIEWTVSHTAPAKKPTPKNAIPAGRLSTREVAEELGIAPARLRVFLRSTGSKFTPVGSGARYSFTKSDLAAIKKAFPAWEKKEKAAKKA